MVIKHKTIFLKSLDINLQESFVTTYFVKKFTFSLNIITPENFHLFVTDSLKNEPI